MNISYLFSDHNLAYTVVSVLLTLKHACFYKNLLLMSWCQKFTHKIASTKFANPWVKTT